MSSEGSTATDGRGISPGRRRIALVVLSASLFLAGMDLTVLHVAVPIIRADLRPSNEVMLWLVDVYSLTVAALLVTCGILGDRVGRKRFAMSGFAVFGLASAACGLSSTVSELMVSRVALGVGTAMIMASTVAILRNVYTDDRQRAFAIGVWTAAHSVGATLGPTIGGLLLEHFSWGAVFLVNVPVVVVVLIVGLEVVPESRDPRPPSLDVPSLVLSILGLAGVAYSVKRVAESAEAALAGLPVGVLALALLVAFVRRQLRLARPLLDVRLFTSRAFSVAVLAVLACFGSYIALLFFFAQWFQYVEHYSTLRAGLALIPLAAANALGAITGPALSERFGQRRVLSCGLLAFALGAAVLALGARSAGFGALGAAFVAAGVGAGIIMTLGADVIMASATPEKAGQAGAIQETTFELSAGLGVALLGTALAVVYSAVLSRTAGPVPPGALEPAARSITDAGEVARSLPPDLAGLLDAAAAAAFDSGVVAVLGAMTAVLTATAVLVMLILPRRVAP